MKHAHQLHDEHMHLRPHGVRPLPHHRLAPLLEACAAKGIVPGIREHAPLPARYRLGPDGDYLFAMRIDEVDGFLGEFVGTNVPVGFEVDHIEGQEAETRAIVEELLAKARGLGVPVGGLTGSVHFIRGCVPDLDPDVDKGGLPHILCDYAETVMQAHLAEHGAEATLREYFAAVRGLIGTGFYDVIGHIELIRKWDRFDERGRSLLYGAVEDVYAAELERTLKLAAEADIVVEYNTSGRDIVIGRPYLSDEAVRMCVRHGVRLALSSDTHLPKHVGRYFPEATTRLRELGVRTLYAARDRSPVAIDL